MTRDDDRLGEHAPLAVDDEVFAALGERARRLALYYLRWRRRADVDELADVVTGWQRADRRGMASRAERDRIRAALHDRHLPVLAEAGLVDYDGAGGCVSPAQLSEPVRSLVDFAFESEWESGVPP